jgi:hypothetical protein
LALHLVSDHEPPSQGEGFVIADPAEWRGGKVGDESGRPVRWGAVKRRWTSRSAA